MGAGVVGTSTARTIEVHKGKPLPATLHSALNSIFYYISVHWIVQNNMQAYLGTALGSTLVILYMAYRNKKQN